MSSEEIAKKVVTAKRYTKLVECYRGALEDDDISDIGFVVDASDDFLMLQLVDDRIMLNGYSLLRICDITDLEIDVEHARFIEKALEIRKKTVKQPVLVDLTDIATLLKSIDESFSLMTLHREAHEPDACWVGSIDSIGEKTVTINEMSPDAKWEGSKRLSFEEITRIDFGGGYERALALVAKIR
jgi:hypothetical protein